MHTSMNLVLRSPLQDYFSPSDRALWDGVWR